jgi:hypothetical protein
MPVEPVELLKLIIGLIILTIPGYLWSYLFSRQLSILERALFGLLCNLAFFTITCFALNSLFHITITQTLVWLLYAVFLIPILILSISMILLRRWPLPTIPRGFLKKPTTILLLVLLCFSFLMMLLPHLQNNYYLPFHVDEWIHYSSTRALIEQGTTSFINPYTGSGIVNLPEKGFYLTTACLHWISTSNLATIFLFMPALIGVLLSLTAFVIGQRSPRRFGLEAAFLVAFIPTTVRFLGPSFYVASTLGLLLLLFLIWLGQLKQLRSILLIPLFILYLFLVHPSIVLAAIGILLVYAVFLLIEKDYRAALLLAGLTVLPIILVVLFTSQWNSIIDLFLTSVSGQQYQLDYNLPKILVSFTDLGLLTWGLLIIGVYFAFIKGKALLQTLSISAFAVIIVIGLYDKFGYGVPYVYERLFLVLFLIVTLIAGFGLAEIRRALTNLKQNERFTAIKKKIQHIDLLIPVTLGIVILLIAVPAHLSTPYYQMITEQDYETFTWIHDNIDTYRDANHTYQKAAVDPFKASPFSAVTGLYILSSSMNPVYRYDLVPKMETFLKEKCTNTSFLDKYKLSIIYGNADNDNLTKIHENVYLYPGLKE